jgi:hypothetical protein
MSVANQKKNNELFRNSLVVKAIELTKQINPYIYIYIWKCKIFFKNNMYWFRWCTKNNWWRN